MKNNTHPHSSLRMSPLPYMILFEMLYKFFLWALIRPLFELILNIALTISGFQIAFNDFMLDFLLTPAGIITALTWIALASILTYWEFAVLITLSGYSLDETRPSLRFLLRETMTSLRNLLHPSTLLFCVYVLGLLPLVESGFSSSLLPGYSIPNFITGELRKGPWGEWVLHAASALVFVIFLASLLVLPVMVLQKRSFGKAFLRSLRFTWQNWKRMLKAYAGFLLLSLISGIPQLVFQQIYGTTSVPLMKIVSVFGLSWSGIAQILLLLLSSAAQVVLLPLLLHLLVRQYALAGGEIELTMPDAAQEASPSTFQTFSRIKIPSVPRWLRWVAVGIVVITLGVSLIQIFNNPPGLHPPIVVGHRGSAYGVENTLEAMQGAIDSGADYTEVDILLSADGVPMVIHDSNLSRLAGENLNVHDLTAEELRQFTLMQNGYTGTIPTLEEAILYCQGKIGLAVEIKLHGHEQGDVVEKTMSILQKYDFVEEYIFVSLDYSLVERIKTHFPEAFVGYSVFGNVGALNPSVLRTMEIDFIVIEESMVSKANLYDLRSAWLPVYVWTVNSALDMQRYLELGVNGLVTDHPDVGMQMVEEYSRSSDVVYLDENEW